MPKNAQTTAQLHSSHTLVMLKILQARLQQYMNCELPDVQAGFRKGREYRDQMVNIHWIIEKAREFQKNIYFCFIDYAKAFDCVDHNKLWKILQEMGIPDCIICLLRNHIKVKSLNHVRPFVTPWTVASSVHGIFQARILEWVAISFSRGSSESRDQTQVSHTVGRHFYCLSHQGNHIYKHV